MLARLGLAQGLLEARQPWDALAELDRFAKPRSSSWNRRRAATELTTPTLTLANLYIHIGRFDDAIAHWRTC